MKEKQSGFPYTVKGVLFFAVVLLLVFGSGLALSRSGAVSLYSRVGFKLQHMLKGQKKTWGTSDIYTGENFSVTQELLSEDQVEQTFAVSAEMLAYDTLTIELLTVDFERENTGTFLCRIVQNGQAQTFSFDMASLGNYTYLRVDIPTEVLTAGEAVLCLGSTGSNLGQAAALICTDSVFSATA